MRGARRGHRRRLPARAAAGRPDRRNPVDRERLGQLPPGRKRAPRSRPARPGVRRVAAARSARRALVRAPDAPAQPVGVPALGQPLLVRQAPGWGSDEVWNGEPGRGRPVLAAAPAAARLRRPRARAARSPDSARTGLYDRALVVVTADHGVSFRAGQKRRPLSDANLQDIAYVPLFVKLPHQKRGRIERCAGPDDRHRAHDRRRDRGPDPVARRRPLAPRPAPGRARRRARQGQRQALRRPGAPSSRHDASRR